MHFSTFLTTCGGLCAVVVAGDCFESDYIITRGALGRGVKWATPRHNGHGVAPVAS